MSENIDNRKGQSEKYFYTFVSERPIMIIKSKMVLK